MHCICSFNGYQSVTHNLRRPGGWDIYKELTEKASDAIEEIAVNEELDINTVMKKIEVIDNQVKFEAFGQTRNVKNKPRGKGEAQGKQSNEELIKKQSEKL